jgi:hypothetical protein
LRSSHLTRPAPHHRQPSTDPHHPPTQSPQTQYRTSSVTNCYSVRKFRIRAGPLFSPACSSRTSRDPVDQCEPHSINCNRLIAWPLCPPTPAWATQSSAATDLVSNAFFASVIRPLGIYFWLLLTLPLFWLVSVLSAAAITTPRAIRPRLQHCFPCPAFHPQSLPRDGTSLVAVLRCLRSILAYQPSHGMHFCRTLASRIDMCLPALACGRLRVHISSRPGSPQTMSKLPSIHCCNFFCILFLARFTYLS